MKVQNATIFMGDASASQRHDGISEEKSGRRSIFAGNMNQSFDPIARKKQQARQQAMKIVGDAWDGERKLDEERAKKKEKFGEYKKMKLEAENDLKGIGKEAEDLRKAYGIEDPAQAQADLELLDKKAASMEEGSKVVLTEEEKERLSRIDETGLREYQEKSQELTDREKACRAQIRKADNGMYAIAAADTDARINKPQMQAKTIMKAQETAEDILEAASKEIIGMLVDEAKDHVDQELEEKKEAAEEKAEKEEEEKEKIEKIKEEKEEKEEFIEDVAQTGEFIVEADNVMKDVQRDIKKVMDEMKLLDEDLKGAAVDTAM